MTGRFRRRAGFTLVELLLSMAVMALLVSATTSAILIASHAIPNPQSVTEKQSAALDVSESIATELATAIRVVLGQPNLIEFEVPDRGHGSAGPETIRYTWSGTNGAPLIRNYNKNAATTVCDDVHAFSLIYTPMISTLTESPKVLLIADDPPSAAIADKQTLMESWGFQVTQIAATKSKAEFDTAFASADVIFLAYEIITNWAQLQLELGAIQNPARGVVLELGLAYSTYGISQILTPFGAPTTAITITDVSHEITAPFALGLLTISKVNQNFVAAGGTYAPGAQQLATGAGNPTLGVLDLNAVTLNGIANARRVHQPCAGALFDINQLTDDGKTIMRRAMVWAAAPVCHGAVTLTLQSGSDSSAAVQAYTQLVNTPRVETP
ncbi:MAG: prepilin-type N-terminal cleavage/methylation domain-containing protein [Planctomycetota bacterium]